MINTEHWEQIISDYKMAWNCLVCPKHHKGTWFRQESKGLYYLLKAYLAAVEEPEKDHLWYARILRHMAHPSHFNLSEYERFHKYLEPAVLEYELVDNPDGIGKEINTIRQEYDILKAQMDFTADDGEESYKRYMSLIDNSMLLYDKDVWFHDGKVVSFTQIGDTATLKYRYGSQVVTIAFEGIVEITLHYDPDEYIFDFVCYPVFQRDSSPKVFDIGSHKITCYKIKIDSVVEYTAESLSQ